MAVEVLTASSMKPGDLLVWGRPIIRFHRSQSAFEPPVYLSLNLHTGAWSKLWLQGATITGA